MSRADLKAIIAQLCPHFGNRPEAWKRAYLTDFEGTIGAQRQARRADRITALCLVVTTPAPTRRYATRETEQVAA